MEIIVANTANVLPVPVIDSGNLGLNPEWLAIDANAGLSSPFQGARTRSSSAKETSRARKKALLIGITYQSAEARNDFDLSALPEAHEDVIRMKRLLTGVLSIHFPLKCITLTY